jgi:hypothetical protein
MGDVTTRFRESKKGRSERTDLGDLAEAGMTIPELWSQKSTHNGTRRHAALVGGIRSVKLDFPCRARSSYRSPVNLCWAGTRDLPPGKQPMRGTDRRQT